MAITNKEINLAQLSEELGGKALTMIYDDPNQKHIKAADGVNLTEGELQAAIDAHIALPNPEPTLEQKLASVGLDLEELKAALSS